MLEYMHFTDKEIETLIDSIVIICDTREKENSHVIETFDKHNIKHMKKGLSHGDYSAMIPANEALHINHDIWLNNFIVVERKANLNELASNITHDRDRFEKELCTYRGRMFLMIENASYSDIINHKYDSNCSVKSFLASFHAFTTRYNLYPLFVSDNKHSALFIWNVIKYYIKDKIKK